MEVKLEIMTDRPADQPALTDMRGYREVSLAKRDEAQHDYQEIKEMETQCCYHS